MLALAFFQRGVYGGVEYTFTLENFARVFDPLYAGIFLNSARIAGIATTIAVVLGYAAAYAIASCRRSLQPVLLFFAVLPFWSNYLIRTYAWIVLLNREGLVTQLLRWFGYEGEPPSMLYTEGAVIAGLVYNYLPFVILACYAPLSRLNPELAEASRDLGGSAFTTFRRIILPLTLPGIAAGAVFVFVLSIGNFVTPALLGGGRFQMIGNLVYDQFLTANDWPFGAALSMALIAIMMLLLLVQAYASDRASTRTAPRQGGRVMAERSAAARRSGAAVLVAIFAFLYVPIAVLVALSFNEGGLPTVWSGFSTKWYVSLAVQPGHLVGGAQHADRRRRIDRHRDAARHAARHRHRDAAAARDGARGAGVRADDHSRHRARGRAALLLLHARRHPGPAHDRAGACRVQPRLRLRGGACAAEILRLVDHRSVGRSRRLGLHHLPKGHTAGNPAGSRSPARCSPSRCRSTSSSSPSSPPAQAARPPPCRCRSIR